MHALDTHGHAIRAQLYEWQERKKRIQRQSNEPSYVHSAILQSNARGIECSLHGKVVGQVGGVDSERELSTVGEIRTKWKQFREVCFFQNMERPGLQFEIYFHLSCQSHRVCLCGTPAGSKRTIEPNSMACRGVSGRRWGDGRNGRTTYEINRRVFG